MPTKEGILMVKMTYDELIKNAEEAPEYQYQKDWIIYDFANDDLLCLTIASPDGKRFSLIEYVNFFNTNELVKLLDMGFSTMLEAMGSIPNYCSIQGKHKFSQDEFDGSFLAKLVEGKAELNEKKSFKPGEIIVDKDEFEKEVAKLFAETFTNKKGKLV